MANRFESKISIRENLRVIVLFALLSPISFGCLSVLIFPDIYPVKAPDLKFYLALWAVFLIPFIIVAPMVWQQVANSPKIIIDRAGITFKTWFSGSTLAWQQIAGIRVIDRKFAKQLIGSWTQDFITILLTDNTTLNIWFKNYSNAAQMRAILNRANDIITGAQNINQLEFDFNPLPKTLPVDVENENFEEFAGNHVFTESGFYIYGLPLVIILGLWKFGFFTPQPAGAPHETNLSLIALSWLAFCGPIFAMLLVIWYFSRQLNYFRLSEKYVVVKNHVWLGRNAIYKLDDILEVAFESAFQARDSPLLVIITRDFATHRYPANSLSRDTWIALKNSLAARNVKIRDERHLV